MLVMFVIYIFCLFGWNVKTNKKVVFSHFAECNGHDTQQSDYLGTCFAECKGHCIGQTSQICQVPRARHSAKVTCLPSVLTGHSANRLPLPSVLPVALGTVATFAECLSQRRSVKRRPLPSAWTVTLGKSVMFAECNGHCTRQSMFPGSSQMVTLPSVMAIALGKVTENNLFYLFFTSHPNKQKIYITNITNITYISPTPHIYHKRHIYITNVTCLTIYHK